MPGHLYYREHISVVSKYTVNSGSHPALAKIIMFDKRHPGTSKTVMFRVFSFVSVVMKTVALVAVIIAPREAAFAHEVPTEVVVQTIVKPGVGELDFLVRVPLEACLLYTSPSPRDRG